MRTCACAPRYGGLSEPQPRLYFIFHKNGEVGSPCAPAHGEGRVLIKTWGRGAQTISLFRSSDGSWCRTNFPLDGVHPDAADRRRGRRSAPTARSTTTTRPAASPPWSIR